MEGISGPNETNRIHILCDPPATSINSGTYDLQGGGGSMDAMRGWAADRNIFPIALTAGENRN